ncbi:hypothetical protein PTKIN_Ptkin16aG0514500 [Pterospermum kingtungense]
MDLKVENGCIEEDRYWEFVRTDSQSVPDRYIQEHKDRPLVSEIFPDSLEIPIIDFSTLSTGDEHERRKLDLACKEWGFFQMINHGVEEEVLHKMMAAVAAFFELPIDEKKKYAMAEDDLQGYGQAYVVSEQQKLDWCDLMFLVTLPLQNRNFKFWPLTLPGFKEALEVYSKEVQMVAEELYANISVLMGMDRDGLKRLQGDLKQAVRLNYYPPCSRPDLVLGVSPHSDGTAITLLLQDDNVTGLQIKHKEDWIPVKPIPNSLVVNVGDVLEILSNGKYQSIEHRACANEKKPRMSVATFMVPGDEVEIGPLESMMSDIYLPKVYKNIKYIDYIRQKFAKKMEGKMAHIAIAKLESK